HQRHLPEGALKTQGGELLEALLLLDEQTQLKLEGERHIPNRLDFIGKPDDRTLYGATFERYRKRTSAYPQGAVTDSGYRSAKNL
ncbi:hypothetical protein C2W62_53680, partial [Candidatus Entotheonella serta]